MFFKELEEFNAIISKCAEEDFLKGVCSKYHYLPKDREQMKTAALAMQPVMRQEALWQHNLRDKTDVLMDGVVITLGAGVDRLQDSYSAKGDISSAYMVEVLSGEILLLTYAAYNNYIAKTTPYHVARYYFPGSEKDYPLIMLKELLSHVSSPVTCNESLCMIPKQSVAFFAQLTEQDNVHCAGVCMNCGRKDCPNRMNKDRPLPYGYARILGKEFL